jgi:formate dehydrogenase assembly factor FdhD
MSQFEPVQKAVMGGAAAPAAVSAPSSLAVEPAEEQSSRSSGSPVATR